MWFAINVICSTILLFLHFCIGSDKIPLLDYVKILSVSIGFYLLINILFFLGKKLGLGRKLSAFRKLMLVCVTLILIVLIINSFTQSFLIIVLSIITPLLIVPYIWSDINLGIELKK